ncbi:immunity 17 family protein [Paenibacillus sp. 1781tsa1]|uniref:immunity 17 family protein n=1 Tax=unclassified Paenibacillus TaxID=185978 RepID=UPI00209D7EC8|nr:immunity 17 family protein [Paenibacillus sp. 1781tsa1]MCP1182741.1 immunity 17 family protein [Paenibacillus sp. 1781tsa1]
MQDQPVLIALFAIAAGIFSLLGGINNWDWFMKSFRAGIFVKTIGRQGARVVYGILGVVLIVIGVLLLLIGKV